MDNYYNTFKLLRIGNVNQILMRSYVEAFNQFATRHFKKGKSRPLFVYFQMGKSRPLFIYFILFKHTFYTVKV